MKTKIKKLVAITLGTMMLLGAAFTTHAAISPSNQTCPACSFTVTPGSVSTSCNRTGCPGVYFYRYNCPNPVCRNVFYVCPCGHWK